MTKPVDRRELHNRIRHLRYSIIEEAIDVLKAEPTKECDRLIEVLLDSVKGLEALLGDPKLGGWRNREGWDE